MRSKRGSGADTESGYIVAGVAPQEQARTIEAMGQKRKRNQQKQESTAAKLKPQMPWGKAIALAVLLALIAVAAHFLLRRNRDGSRRQTSPASVASTTVASDSQHTAASNETGEQETDDQNGENSLADFKSLKGRWLRTDARYEIVVKSVEADGSMEAAYYNPEPIRVSQAKATQDGDTTKVFIELRDVGYPGCTYRLDYDPQNDRLEGVYFQAAMQQNYEVVFNRQ